MNTTTPQPPVTSSEARFLWGMIPHDCKSALSYLKSHGLLDHAKPELVDEAEKGIKLACPNGFTPLDVAAALEVAAEHWLAARSLSPTSPPPARNPAAALAAR